MTRYNKALALGLAPALLTGTAQAAVDFQVTESYAGISGEDGTPDWFEVTNFGTTTGDTGTLIYDDSTPTVANAGALTSFSLATGESAVFIIGGDNDDIADFTTIWGNIANLGIADGGGNLGDGVDSVNIGVDNAGTFDIIDTLAHTSVEAGELGTIDDATGAGPITNSVVGVNGAYESNPFFNDNIGDSNDLITLVGSPGIVPEPSSLALLALGGLAMIRRRRG